MARGYGTDFKTTVGRFAYTKGLFVATAQEEGKRKQFGATMIFPVNTNRAVFMTAIEEALEMAWPGKWKDLITAGIIKTPFLKGDSLQARHKETGALHAGMGPDVWFIRPSANEDKPPLVIWKDKHIPCAPADFYSGCYGYAVLNAYTWENDKGGKGVSFGLRLAQKTLEGERLGGEGGAPVNVDKYYEKVEDAGAAPESTKGGAGAGGLFGD